MRAKYKREKKKWHISNYSEDNTKGWHILKKDENIEVLEAILKEDTKSQCKSWKLTQTSVL